MDNKFADKVKEYFGVSPDYITVLIKELDKLNWDTEKLALTEQFNLWFIEWMKESAKQLELFFKENVEKPVQDFKEISPDSIVKDRTVSAYKEEVTEEEWKI